VSNFYLVEESGKLVLVDAGTPKDWALFTRAASGLGQVVGDLDAVLLTHAHTDHTGFAGQDRPGAITPSPARHQHRRSQRGIGHGGLRRLTTEARRSGRSGAPTSCCGVRGDDRTWPRSGWERAAARARNGGGRADLDVGRRAWQLPLIQWQDFPCT
jgi:glyoxylase-like metal-dependent hydrolase (beta-lactamase superfamily II)